MTIVKKVQQDLQKVSSKKRAQSYMRFFKTGVGQYGEGDIFIGVTVPEQRKVAKRFFEEISIEEVGFLIKSPVHEYRFTALEILVFKFEQAKTEKERERYIRFYLKNLNYVNNWDLVDTSAYCLLGEWLYGKKDKKILYKLSKSTNIWERRISIVATYAFIRKDFFSETLKIEKNLLKDEHDLIHKAVGWMLREVGNRDLLAEEKFLKKFYKKMPRTMLRYAIEKFPENKRKAYLSGVIS